MGNQASSGVANRQNHHRGRRRHGGHTGPLGDTTPADWLMTLSLRGSSGLQACNCDPDTAALMQSALAQSYRPGLKWCNHDGRLWTAKLQGQPWHSQCPREIDQMAKHALSQLLQSLFRAGWRHPVAMETLRRSQLCIWLLTKQSPLPETEVFCLAPSCSDRLTLLGRPPPGAYDAVVGAVQRCWPKGLRPAAAGAPGCSHDNQLNEQQQGTTELRLRGNPWNAYERELRDASQCLAACAAAIGDIKEARDDRADGVRWRLAMACCVRASQPSCLFFYSRSVRGERLVRKNGGENGGEIGKIHQFNKGEGEGERNATNLATKLDCRYRLLGFSPPDYVRLLPSDQALLSAMYHRLTKSSRSPCQQQQQQEQLLEEQQRQPLQQQHKHLRLGGSPWRPDTPVAARSARLAVLELLNAAAWSVGVPDSWLPSQPIRASCVGNREALSAA
ncbi:hypothetical protein BOX15_Mlig032275g3 [Macrostomum lignano]|uniref:Uncharacterized protein n=1 Tax=Macrostomum lignano TaxID=282301 RepID=A0A267GCH1_9PLAT|nr:hypothetical protein BOX15_Mlig032275g3 [Macrostomum lignano]